MRSHLALNPLALSAVLLLLASTSSWAFLGVRFSKPIEDYKSAVEKLEKEIKKENGNLAVAIAAVQEAEIKVSAAQQEQQRESDARDAAYNKLLTESSNLGGKIAQLKVERDQAKYERNRNKAKELGAKIKENEKILKDLKNQTGNARKAAERAKSDLEKTEREMGKINERAQRLALRAGISLPSNANPQEIATALADRIDQNNSINTVQDAARGFWNDFRHDLLKTEILLKDLELVRQELDHDENKLNAIKEELEPSLDNTLMGDYILQKIAQSLILNCNEYEAIKKACDEKNPKPILDLLKKSSSAAESTKTELKPVDATSGAASPSNRVRPGTAATSATNP